MSRVPIAAAAGAILLHAGVLLFGGLLLPRKAQDAEVREDVGLMDETEAARPDEPGKKVEKAETDKTGDVKDAETQPVIAEPSEPMPDLQSLAALDAAPAGPALDALSLNDLESALDSSGGVGGGSFGQGFNLASGGRIGAAGGFGGGAAALEEIVSIADLDQRPRPIAQTSPMYPAEMRRRRVEGSVSIVFLVDIDGHVVSPAVEKSSDPAFDRPALEAIRHWRFEPGTRLGKKVQFKMRVPITFRAGA